MTQNNLEAKKSVCVRERITHEQCMNIMKIKMRRIVFRSQAVRCTLNDFEKKKKRNIECVHNLNDFRFVLRNTFHFFFAELSSRGMGLEAKRTRIERTGDHTFPRMT